MGYWTAGPASNQQKVARMKAEVLVSSIGKSLVGKKVITKAMGDYPGGVAIVETIQPDPNAPEISFNVSHPTAGMMGIFDYEEVDVIE